MPESLRVKCYKFSKINDPLQDGEQSQAFMTFHYSEPVFKSGLTGNGRIPI